MYKILTFNNIAQAGLQRLPRKRYEVAPGITHPDAIILRSHNMHDMDIPASVVAIGRAGAGVNNIPIEKMNKRGIPVFNAPGANANAVKEIAIAGLLLAARNICRAWEYAQGLQDTDDDLDKTIEASKKQFVGFELSGRTLGVVGLGAVGIEVANTALVLGMKVIGFDPHITVRQAWKLSSGVEQTETLDQLFKKSDVVSMHVPLVKGTSGLVNHDKLSLMRKGGVLINFSRSGVVDNEAVLESLDSDYLHAYVCDFPTEDLIAHPQVIALPHLGASTMEAEENCVSMIVENIKEYLENGNIRHSVNFPETILPRVAGAWRITISNTNVPNMVGQISTCLAEGGLNIKDLLNKSLGAIAYTVIDLDEPISKKTLGILQRIDGILALRTLGKPLS
jgi:D-3-phosphoglycerate dehydrogenase